MAKMTEAQRARWHLEFVRRQRRRAVAEDREQNRPEGWSWMGESAVKRLGLLRMTTAEMGTLFTSECARIASRPTDAGHEAGDVVKVAFLAGLLVTAQATRRIFGDGALLQEGHFDDELLTAARKHGCDSDVAFKAVARWRVRGQIAMYEAVHAHWDRVERSLPAIVRRSQ